MMPPVLSSLGPITDWLSRKMVNAFSTKYDEVSRASSAAKVFQSAILKMRGIHTNGMPPCEANCF